MTGETLHRRHRQLLTLLKNHRQVITSKELAVQLEVSDRTVRDDVRALNPILGRYHANIETIRGKGLILRVNGPSAPLNDLLYSWDSLETPEERSTNLLFRLLLCDEGFGLGDLEDEMHVSKTTLENDIQFLRRSIMARRPYLHLKRGGNRIAISAPERSKRLALTKIFAESWDYHTRAGLYLDNSPLETQVFQLVLDRTKAALKRNDIKLDDYDLIALAFTVAVAEFRIRTGHPLEDAKPFPEEARQVAGVVHQLLEELEGACYQTRFDAGEREDIMLSLWFRQNRPGEPRSREDLRGLVDQRALQATDLILERILQKHEVDLYWDEQLYADLARHIYRLDKRLCYGFERQNSLLFSIKTNYVFFFEMALTIGECFQAVYGVSLSEDECGYFANPLITSAYRATTARFPNGIPVAFVSHLGRSDRDMLVSQLLSIYGNNISLKGPFSIYEREKILDAQPQMILSTIHQESVRSRAMNLTSITIPTPLTEDTFLQINKHIRRVHEQTVFRPLTEELAAYFDPALFFPGVALPTAEKAITFLTQHIVELGYSTPECIGRALAREAASATAANNGAAVPRVCVPSSVKTTIAVAVLQKSISWGGQKVGVVFLLSAAEKDLPIYGTLLNYLVNDLCDAKKLKGIKQAQSFSAFTALL